MEVAEPGKSSVDSDTVAYGVEVCKCPDRYSGLSCQVYALFYMLSHFDVSLNSLVFALSFKTLRFLLCKCFVECSLGHISENRFFSYLIKQSMVMCLCGGP